MPNTAFELPLSPKAQSFFVRLSGTLYYITFRWNTPAACWVMSLTDVNKTPLLDNINVVTGLDLLAPYKYLGIPGSIVVQTDHDTDAVPTYTNLGDDGKVYYVTTT